MSFLTVCTGNFGWGAVSWISRGFNMMDPIDPDSGSKTLSRKTQRILTNHEANHEGKIKSWPHESLNTIATIATSDSDFEPSFCWDCWNHLQKENDRISMIDLTTFIPTYLPFTSTNQPKQPAFKIETACTFAWSNNEVKCRLWSQRLLHHHFNTYTKLSINAESFLMHRSPTWCVC